MKFKVHKVDELYPDLQLYGDKRDVIASLAFVLPATTVEYSEFVDSLVDIGYRVDSQLYYLSPVPGSEPSTGLHKIDGRDDMTQMLSAHAEQRTKICHLYLVNPCEVDPCTYMVHPYDPYMDDPYMDDPNMDHMDHPYDVLGSGSQPYD
jgi:hypothetical protein